MKSIGRGKSLCVYSPKGGVGKTVLSMNLAGLAGLQNKKVLLVDYDMFNGGLCILINEDINKTVYNLVDDIANNRFNNIKDYVYNYNENIDILCSPKDPRQGSKINPKYLDLILERATNIYDLVIIDTASVLDEINLFTLDKVDNILFVVTNDMFSIKNLKNIINIFSDNGFTNYKVLYNSSFDPKESYFSMFDIKKLIGANIDYTLDKSFFMKQISSYLFNNQIPVLVKDVMKRYKNNVRNMQLVIEDVFKEEERDGEKK